jgi:hypothetical protein
MPEQAASAIIGHIDSGVYERFAGLAGTKHPVKVAKVINGLTDQLMRDPSARDIYDYTRPGAPIWSNGVKERNTMLAEHMIANFVDATAPEVAINGEPAKQILSAIKKLPASAQDDLMKRLQDRASSVLPEM